MSEHPQPEPPWDALWGLRPTSDRGRKASLRLQTVVDAAVEIADAEGLDAVSMSRLSGSLGCAPMALYRHVTNKDELIALMVDGCLDPSAVPPVAGADWREAMEQWARSLRAVVGRHPWLIRVNLAQVPFGPNRLAWLEQGLRALSTFGVEEPDHAEIVLLVNGFVFSAARMAEEVASSGGEVPASFAGLPQVLDPERFPAVVAALSGGITGQDDREQDAFFEFGLTTLLDGLEAHVSRSGQ